MGTSCFTEQINKIARSENFKEICDIEVVKREYNTLADPEIFRVSFVVREHLPVRSK